MIIEYFGDGSKWNVNITYIKEEKPLGTAGALKLLPEELNNPILIVNGDVLTNTNFQDLFYYHHINKEMLRFVRVNMLSIARMEFWRLMVLILNQYKKNLQLAN